MKKVLFFLVIFLSIHENSFTNTNKSSISYTGCKNLVDENYLNIIDKLKIKSIEVDVHSYKDWTVNSIRILTSKYRFTSDKFKKRFSSTIKVNYENGVECVFLGRVRHSGDQKDHISLLGNTIIQSLDVHLDEGNIRGITKFKLLRPKTRGNLEDEILITEILRSLNYLAPRTLKVNVRINEAHSEMIFQEKAAKELLEFNKRREAPILEADERFFWKRVEKLPDNRLSSESVGAVPLFNKGAKHLAAKQTNSTIITKSDGYKTMSFDSLTKLNLIHFYYSNKFQNDFNDYHFSEYDLDNTLLGLLNEKNILKLDMYNLLALATSGRHGLSTPNRKFYWNSIENYFEPINYDSNSYITNYDTENENIRYRLPISNYFYKAFDILYLDLSNLDTLSVSKKIQNNGIYLSKENVDLKINYIKNNLDVIKKRYLDADQNLVEKNKFKSINNILNIFNKNLEEVDSDIYLVKHHPENNKLQRCQLYLKNCENYNFSVSDLSKLLEGKLVLGGKTYQYIGNSTNLETLFIKKDYKSIDFINSKIFYEDGVEITISIQDNLITINQTKRGSKSYIINGDLINTKIKYNGFKTEEIHNVNLKNKPKNYPSDSRGLTGCISFINLTLENISLNANNSSCEDAVNFINVSGTINNIEIINSYSDGLDIDFSNLKINNINISSAGNDCADFSAGKYDLEKLTLINCGDKALSVGEKSFVKINEINASKAATGIASKDSSVVKLNLGNFKDLKTCLSAYNKKQEFNGGIIEIKNMKCFNYNNKFISDSYSKIIEKNKTL